MQPADIRALSEAWNKVNEYELIPQELAETVQSAVEELWEECVLEEQDLSEEQLEIVLEEAAMEYIEEAKVTFGHDTKEPAKRYSDGSRVGATRRLVRKQVSSAIRRGREKASGAVAGAKIAGSIAKDEAKRAGRAAQHSVTKAADAVKSAPGKAKEKAKSGIKGFIKRQAEKVVKRMSEEAIQEADSIAAMRERAAKRRKQRYGASDTSRGGRDDFRPYTKADYERGEANDPRKKVEEELELDQMIESLVERGHTEQEAYAFISQFTLDEAQEARNNPEKYEREQGRKYEPVRGEKTPMPPRGDKRREDFEKWYAAQRR